MGWGLATVLARGGKRGTFWGLVTGQRMFVDVRAGMTQKPHSEFKEDHGDPGSSHRSAMGIRLSLPPRITRGWGRFRGALGGTSRAVVPRLGAPGGSRSGFCLEGRSTPQPQELTGSVC